MLKIANHTHYHKTLARQLVEQVQAYDLEPEMMLNIDDKQVNLCAEINGQRTCYSHAFDNAKLQQRARQKNQALLTACNNKKHDIVTVLDLTAGWGKDSFVMASHGQQVTMLEHNPLIFACIDYLLQIAQADNPQPVFERLRLIRQNSLEYLQQTDGIAADCLYLDPMFPAHKSTARPGKDLQLLQLLTGNLDIDQLFQLALQKAGKRVVVKRPLHAARLRDRKADIVYREKSVRFDVYLCPVNPF